MDIIISNTAKEPIYEQISSQIKNLILQGKLQSDEPLPSIRKLAKELKVSVITTKRAYEELEKEGYIVTVGGKGTFVAPQSPQFLQEKRLYLVEQYLAQAVEVAKSLKVSLEELTYLVNSLYKEE
ncbi:MAG: GntR family transcriptional regulator [Zhaonellaceae bacterium]|jgi:GntR family transcriptional regulator|nr:GntR family transcriptional regulator [Clostridia bacterium]